MRIVRRSTIGMLLALLLVSASDDVNLLTLTGFHVGNAIDVDRILAITLRVADTLTDLAGRISGSAFAATWLEPAGVLQPSETSLRPPPQYLNAWLESALACLAGALFASLVLTIRHRKAKGRDPISLQVQALKKKLQLAQTVADSDRRWLNKQNRELQAQVDRMTLETKADQRAAFLAGRPFISASSLQPAKLRKFNSATQKQDMHASFDKAFDHLQNIEDAAASLVPILEQPPAATGSTSGRPTPAPPASRLPTKSRPSRHSRRR